MTDTAVTDGSVADSDAPPVLPTLPMLPTLPSVPTAPTVSSPAPLAAPAQFVAVESDQILPHLPPADLPVLPSLPTPEPKVALDIPTGLVDDIVAGEPQPRQHPMAHLMPEKSKPNDVSIRAAQQRAARKSRSRKIKIASLIVVVAASALLGPRLVSWVTEALDEAGSTRPGDEAPPVETSIDDLIEGNSGVTPSAGLDAIDNAKQLVDDTNATP